MILFKLIYFYLTKLFCDFLHYINIEKKAQIKLHLANQQHKNCQKDLLKMDILTPI